MFCVNDRGHAVEIETYDENGDKHVFMRMNHRGYETFVDAILMDIAMKAVDKYSEKLLVPLHDGEKLRMAQDYKGHLMDGNAHTDLLDILWEDDKKYYQSWESCGNGGA